MALPAETIALDEPSLSIGWVGGKGRGVIAGRDLASGALIERAPATEFPAEERPLIDKTALFSHYFVDPESYRGSPWVRGYIAFGLSSLCNHSAGPNARVRWRRDSLGLWAELVALSAIAAGEEITVFYTNIEEYPNRDDFVP